MNEVEKELFGLVKFAGDRGAVIEQIVAPLLIKESGQIFVAIRDTSVPGRQQYLWGYPFRHSPHCALIVKYPTP